MSTKIDNQLVQVYVQEAMKNAAQSRAERKRPDLRVPKLMLERPFLR